MAVNRDKTALMYAYKDLYNTANVCKNVMYVRM